MKKIFIEDSPETGFNAGSKARNDCDSILREAGYRMAMIYVSSKPRKKKRQHWYNPLKVSWKLLFCRKCVLQYPLYYIHNQEKDYMRMFRHYKGELICLIHDINSLRYGNPVDDGFLYVMHRADKVIVHTQGMKRAVVEKTGINPDKVEILYLFDYLTSSPCSPVDPDGKTVIFAGNLEKSLFVRELGKLSGDVSYNLYGAPSSNVSEGPCCTYKGKFHPDDTSAIEGNWGLVWDGDSVETCSGTIGEYLKINSSHKISLYLAACKPVIIWEESSLKDFILSNHLGIAVRSLSEIGSRIDSLTAGEKRLIAENVARISAELRSGSFLKKFI